MVKLIVHADDFGLTQKVNQGIKRAHTKGILTSTSIISNGEAFDDAVEIYRDLPSLDLGVHLTLVEERPFVPPETIPSLVDDQGRFHCNAAEFTRKYFLRKITMNEVEVELDGQIKKTLDHGLRISHLDSHQHLHMLPKILDITVRLARKYHIPYIRYPRETTQKWMLKQGISLTRYVQAKMLNGFCRMAKDLEGMRTDHFMGFLFSGKLDKQKLVLMLEHLPSQGVCELMCHPGMDDPDSKYAYWGYQCAQETAALADPEVSALSQYKNIKLLTFNDLKSN